MAGKRQPRVTCGDTREIRVIADIGGTLARFALIDAAGDALEIGIQGAQICVGRHDVGPEHLQVEDDERGIKRLYGLAGSFGSDMIRTAYPTSSATFMFN